MLNFADLKNENWVKDFLAPRVAGYFPEIKNPNLLNCEIAVVKEKHISPEAVIVLVKLKIESEKNQIGKSVIINVREDGGYYKKDFQLLGHLQKNGFNIGQFQAPRPLEYSPTEKFFIYEAAKGFPLRHFIVYQQGSVSGSCFLAGRALAKLHQVPLDDALSSQDEIFRRLINFNLENPKIDSEIFLTRLAEIKNQQFVHGDCQPANFLFNGENISLIDFENAFVGSGAADLASFLVQLENVIFYEELEKPIEDSTIKNWQEQFLAGYQKEIGAEKWSLVAGQIDDFKLFYRLQSLLFVVAAEKRADKLAFAKEKLGKLISTLDIR